ncbi:MULTISPECIES: hypothetical protein [unclassified Streptomyces]|uniref:hypothetical protein n=1 Tax=unclassified Streptomyces TaxID=2593676 RepID=UPI000BF19B09|nr:MULTISPECIES: hypothetical protein [unclassified Streptomyces]
MTDSTEELPHNLRVINQVRRTPNQADNQTWPTNELTGMVHITCNCGYSTGWIPRDQAPDREKTRAEHPGSLQTT